MILEVAAEAIGAPTDFVPAYQWKKRYWSPNAVAYVDSNVTDNGRITGSNSSRLTIRDVQNSDTLDQYVCEVIGYCGDVTSKPAKLFMPVVTAATNSPVACEGAMITVECAVLPSVIPGSVTEFQWYFNGARLSDGGDVFGSNQKVLMIDNVTTANAGEYRCDVSYSGADAVLASNTVDITVGTAPVVSGQPVGDTICEGESFMLTAAGDGEAITYHWQKGTTLIPGATEATYEVEDATADDAGTYSCQITNACGQVVTENVDVVVNTAAEITTDPTDVAVFDGDEIEFSVETDGSEPVSYQWYKDDEAIDGADSSSFVIDSATGEDAGTYYVIVSNDCGDDTSQVAVADVTVGVAGGEILPGGYVLEFATPNPASDVVRFNYTIPSSQNVEIALTDATGRQITSLVNGWVNAGTHTVEFSAMNLGLAQGVYTYTFEANGTVAAHQVVIVK